MLACVTINVHIKQTQYNIWKLKSKSAPNKLITSIQTQHQAIVFLKCFVLLFFGHILINRLLNENSWNSQSNYVIFAENRKAGPHTWEVWAFVWSPSVLRVCLDLLLSAQTNKVFVSLCWNNWLTNGSILTMLNSQSYSFLVIHCPVYKLFKAKPAPKMSLWWRLNSLRETLLWVRTRQKN